MLGLPAVLLALLPAAGDPASAPRPDAAFVPPISVCQAIERVESWAAEHGVDTSGQFVQSVRLATIPDEAGSPPAWEVVYRWARPRLGGELSALVRMDGRVTARPLGP